MKDEVKSVFDLLQQLDMKPTPNNVSIMTIVYDTLRGLFNDQKEGENSGGSSSDPE